MFIKLEANLSIYHLIDIFVEKHMALKVALLDYYPCFLHIGDISDHLVRDLLKDL